MASLEWLQKIYCIEHMWYEIRKIFCNKKKNDNFLKQVIRFNWDKKSFITLKILFFRAIFIRIYFFHLTWNIYEWMNFFYASFTLFLLCFSVSNLNPSKIFLMFWILKLYKNFVLYYNIFKISSYSL